MPFSAEKPAVMGRVAELTARFSFYIAEFDTNPPFTDGQLEVHLATIGLRQRSQDIKEALADDNFARSLYATLRLWGIGKRKSKLVPFGEFASALKHWATELSALQDVKLDMVVDAETVAKLWNLVAHLGIVENKNTVVAGTKCLHHLLPDLVPPMDRDYTQTFFGWENPDFQNHPRECFEYAFLTFAKIAERVKPFDLVGKRWRSSGTKIIDNGVVGYCRVNGLESSNRKYERKRKSKIRALTERAKALGIYYEIEAEAKRRTQRLS